MYMAPSSTPLTKKQLDEIERDRKAQMDLELLIEAEKIKRDPERFKSALLKKKQMEAELEQIAPKAPAKAEEK